MVHQSVGVRMRNGEYVQLPLQTITAPFLSCSPSLKLKNAQSPLTFSSKGEKYCPPE